MIVDRVPSGIGLTLPDMAGLSAYLLGTDDPPVGITVRLAENAGRDNVLYAPSDFVATMPLMIHVLAGAAANTMVIGQRSAICGHVFFHSGNGLLVFGEDVRQPSPVTIRLWSMFQSVLWGRASTSNGTTIIVHGRAKGVLVGDGCMFAEGIMIRTSDQHGFFEMSSGVLLSAARHVLIEPHVWLCQDALVLKGTHLGFGSIVGARAVVTRDVARHTMVAGQPARVLKTDVGWTPLEHPEPGYRERLNLERERLPGLDAFQTGWSRFFDDEAERCVV